MGLIGFIVSLLAGVFMLVGLIPLLGWLNWFTTLPLAVIAAALCGFQLAKNRDGFAVAGLVISIAVIIVAIGRLYIGCGII